MSIKTGVATCVVTPVLIDMHRYLWYFRIQEPVSYS